MIDMRLVKGKHVLAVWCFHCPQPIVKDGLVASTLLTEIRPWDDLYFFHRTCFATWKKQDLSRQNIQAMDMATFVLMLLTALKLNISDILRVYESAAFEHMSEEHGGE